MEFKSKEAEKLYWDIIEKSQVAECNIYEEALDNVANSITLIKNRNKQTEELKQLLKQNNLDKLALINNEIKEIAKNIDTLNEEYTKKAVQYYKKIMRIAHPEE